MIVKNKKKMEKTIEVNLQINTIYILTTK